MDMVGGRELTVLLPYGPRLKESRRLFAQTVGSADALREMSHNAEAEAREFVRRILMNHSQDELPHQVRL
jgi:hypothetical protein